MNNNVVALIGLLKSLERVEEVNGMPFTGYKTEVQTERKSGAKDVAVVLVSPELVEGKEDLMPEAAIMVTGHMQTHKNFSTGKVMVFVLANMIEAMRGKHWEYENDVRIKGTLGRGLTYRDTPLGKHIADMFIKVPCILKELDCFIPCICWGNNAKKVADWEQGREVVIKGRLQSREYIKALPDNKKEVRICYEISVAEVE